MNNIVHIAINTFREAIRDKILYVIVFFALLMVVVSRAIGWISVGQQEQVVKHFSLAIMSFFGALIAVFVGTSLICKEIDKRTIYTILSKPVARFEFLLGKFAGLVTVLFLVTMTMGVLVSIFIKLSIGGSVNLIYFQAIILVFFELMVVTAVAIMFSTVSSPVLSAIFTFSAYLVGQVTNSLMKIVAFKPLAQQDLNNPIVDDLSRFLSVSHEILAPISKMFYYLLPNMSHFALRNRVVFGPPLATGEFSGAIIYGLVYSAFILLVAIIFFERRRF